MAKNVTYSWWQLNGEINLFLSKQLMVDGRHPKSNKSRNYFVRNNEYFTLGKARNSWKLLTKILLKKCLIKWQVDTDETISLHK